MRGSTLLQAAGAAAVMGGTLRIANIFISWLVLNHAMLSYLYFLTDVFLLFGLTGWYLSRASRLGVSGLAGFTLSVVSILMIRNGELFGYFLGAGLLLVGLAVMNLPTLLRRDGSIGAPASWLTALAAALVYRVAALPAGAIFGIAAQVLFGMGFILAGAELLRTSRET